MENNKSKKILGIISVMWGVLLLIYQILRNTVLSDWYFDTYMGLILRNTKEEADQFKAGFEAMNNLINGTFIVALIVIIIFLIIYHKKRNIKIFSKEASNNGSYLIYSALLFILLLGINNLISLIFVTLGGFLFCIKKK